MIRTSNPPATTAKDAPGRQPGQPIKSWAENTGKLSRFRKENGIVGAGGHRSLYRSLTTPVKLSVGGEWALQECEKLTTWANSHLKRKKFRLVNDLRKSLSDGLTLVNLIECLTSEKVPSIQTRPIIRAQKTENLQKCLYYLEGRGVPIQDITAKDLAEGNLKATLTIISRLKEIFESPPVNGTSELGEEGEQTEPRPHSAPSSGTERLGNGDGEADTSLSESLEPESGRLYPGDDPNEVRHAYYDDRAISHQKPVYSGGGLREDILPGSMATDDEEEDISQSEIPPTLQSTTEMGSHGVSQHGADSRRQIIGLSQAIREKARISVSTEVPGSPNKLQAWDTQAMFTAPAPVRDQVSLTVEERLKSLLDSPYLEEMAGSPRKKGYLEGELLLPPPPKGHSPFSYPDGIDNPGLDGGMNGQATELGLGSGYVPSHPNQKGRVATRGEAVLRMRGAGRTEAHSAHAYSNGPPTQQLVNGSPNIRGRPVAGEHSPGRPAAHKPSPGPPGRPSGQERRGNPHTQAHQPSKTPPAGKKGVPPPAYGQQDRSHIPGGNPHAVPHHSGPSQSAASRLYLQGGHHPQQRIHAGSSQQSQTRQFWLQQQQDQQHLQWQKPHDLEEDSRQHQPEPTSRPVPAPRSRPPNATPTRGQQVPNLSNTPQRGSKTSSSSSYSSPSTLSQQSATSTKQGRIPPPYRSTSTPSKADPSPEHQGSFLTNTTSKVKSNTTQHLSQPPAATTANSMSNPRPDLDLNFSGTGTISETSSRSSTPPLPPLSPSNTPPITPPGSPVPIVRPARSMSTTVLPSAHVSPITQTDRKKTEPGRKGRKGSTRVTRSASTLQAGFSMLGKKKGSRKNGNSLRGGSREDDSQSEDGESMSMSEAELVRQQLTALEEMYREILRLLGADQSPHGPTTLTRKPTLTKLKRAGSSLGKPASVVKQRAKDIRSVNRRFARLESHVVTLARSVAHLSSELRTQNALVQEIELLRQELENLKEQQKILQRQQLAQRKPPDRHQSHSRNTPLLVLPVKNSARLAKLTKFFGAEPPLLSIFLKKIGYEKYVKNFEAERIGILELPYMNEDRLKQIGVPMGPRVRILQEAKAALL
ncbi:protein sickie-like isoform X2 [Branchiostoma lanceolatum]|uniref:protein sickie-like isoform X2 n=1 Tax=Branchiostoma lanceolatum TaxID=7740 RepID=UPI003452B529